MLAASLGGLLADMGPRVLLIDANIQPSLSHQAPKGLTYVIDHGAITQECISHSEIDGLDIILSEDPEGTLQHKLATRADGMFRLSGALAPHHVRRQLRRRHHRHPGRRRPDHSARGP
ncbi:ParA family protein [Cupriavidus sp. SK-3]|uniref:ParA family protein n=1 Tax=Cupriavidus sp. SK-3 TaxID=1470558 RepID=UPI0039C89F73